MSSRRTLVSGMKPQQEQRKFSLELQPTRTRGSNSLGSVTVLVFFPPHKEQKGTLTVTRSEWLLGKELILVETMEKRKISFEKELCVFVEFEYNKKHRQLGMFRPQYNSIKAFIDEWQQINAAADARPAAKTSSSSIPPIRPTSNSFYGPNPEPKEPAPRPYKRRAPDPPQTQPQSQSQKHPSPRAAPAKKPKQQQVIEINSEDETPEVALSRRISPRRLNAHRLTSEHDVILRLGKECSSAPTLCHADLNRLNYGENLNDVLIAVSLKILERKFASVCKERVHCFNTFFFEKARKRDESVHKWTKSARLFEKDFVFVPVHNSFHWCLVIVCYPNMLLSHSLDWVSQKFTLDSKRPMILYLDSLGTANASEFCRVVRKFLFSEWKERKLDTLYPDVDSTDKGFDDMFPTKSCKVPAQPNLHDCGVYMLEYVDRFLSDLQREQETNTEFKLPIKRPDWFSYADINHKRITLYNVLEHMAFLQSQNVNRLFSQLFASKRVAQLLGIKRPTSSSSPHNNNNGNNSNRNNNNDNKNDDNDKISQSDSDDDDDDCVSWHEENHVKLTTDNIKEHQRTDNNLHMMTDSGSDDTKTLFSHDTSTEDDQNISGTATEANLGPHPTRLVGTCAHVHRMSYDSLPSTLGEVQSVCASSHSVVVASGSLISDAYGYDVGDASGDDDGGDRVAEVGGGGGGVASGNRSDVGDVGDVGDDDAIDERVTNHDVDSGDDDDTKIDDQYLQDNPVSVTPCTCNTSGNSYANVLDDGAPDTYDDDFTCDDAKMPVQAGEFATDNGNGCVDEDLDGGMLVGGGVDCDVDGGVVEWMDVNFDGVLNQDGNVDVNAIGAMDVDDSESRLDAVIPVTCKHKQPN